LTLSTYSVGDTNYVAKMNSDNVAIAAAVTALQGIVGAAAGAPTSLSNVLSALFGAATALIGAGSYLPSGSGSTLSVAAGFAWLPSIGNVVQAAGGNSINFSGFTAATYYLTVDANGTPSSVAASDPNTLYSIVWTGSAFGAITRIAPVVAAGAEINISQFISGTPGIGEDVVSYLCPDSESFPADFAGSLAVADTAPSGTDVFNVLKNGSTIGTLTFTASITGVFAVTGTTSPVRGDVLKLRAAGTPTLVGLNVSIIGTRL
jgi:hypothetical protein